MASVSTEKHDFNKKTLKNRITKKKTADRKNHQKNQLKKEKKTTKL